MAKSDKIFDRIILRLNFELEIWFYPVLFWGLIIFAMLTVFLSIDAWGLIYASVITFTATICTAVFWRVQARFRRSFRSSLMLGLLMLTGFALFVLVGSEGHKTPTYLLILPITLGIFALLSGSLLAWKSFMRVSFVGRNDLLTEDIAKVLFNLPDKLQANQKVLDAFGSMARISWLFANNEFSLVINVVGSSIENLLREIYPQSEARVGVSAMAKSLGIDVSYKKQALKSKNSFDVTYFWHDVRSKYAHTTGIEKVGNKKTLIFSVLKEPSEETTEMSIGVLSVFLKAYSEYCKKLSTEEKQNQAFAHKNCSFSSM